jgi:hypothetical protein
MSQTREEVRSGHGLVLADKWLRWVEQTNKEAEAAEAAEAAAEPF